MEGREEGHRMSEEVLHIKKNNRAGQIFLYDDDPDDVLVVFNGQPGAIQLGSQAGGFELEEGE